MRRLARGLTLGIVCLALGSGARGDQDDDLKAVKEVVNSFYTAFAKKDEVGVMKVWSKTATNLDGRRKRLRAIFEETGTIEVKEVEFVESTVDDGKAEVRVSVRMIARKAGSDEFYFPPGPMIWLWSLVQDGSDWKVSKFDLEAKDGR